MLEASDCEAVNIVSTFIGAIADDFWRLVKAADITQVFTTYVEMVRLL